MNWNDHLPPHFHARYSEHQATFRLNGDLLQGKFPPRAQNLVKEWAIIHEKELADVWLKAMQHEELPWIKPLP